MRALALAIPVSILVATLVAGPAHARRVTPARLEPAAVNDAALPRPRGKGIDAGILRAQIMLDRLRFSPGVIDGRPGGNFDAAVAAFQQANSLDATGKLDQQTWDLLVQNAGGPVLADATTKAEDVKGPFLKRIPAKMEDMAKLDRLGWRSPVEALSERYHVDERLLPVLNPGASFDDEGTEIVVPDVSRPKLGPKTVTSIEVDIDNHRLRAFDREGRLVASYPATIGSDEKPPPHGVFKVMAVARNPVYTYNPKFAFKGVKSTKPFSIKPGPNNPVGAVWIDLSAETYGIHGTPEPRLIGKTSSHGCVRLTNWDALDLAALVDKGTVVDFVGGTPGQGASLR
jgi:lipoprotein-anchoring transpeptidase ErfK/SrfK